MPDTSEWSEWHDGLSGHQECASNFLDCNGPASIGLRGIQGLQGLAFAGIHAKAAMRSNMIVSTHKKSIELTGKFEAACNVEPTPTCRGASSPTSISSKYKASALGCLPTCSVKAQDGTDVVFHPITDSLVSGLQGVTALPRLDIWAKQTKAKSIPTQGHGNGSFNPNHLHFDSLAATFMHTSQKNRCMKEFLPFDMASS
eukprot:1160501-Pelagomonas_calceolata.AAC.3